ncbi:MAG: hypothetical protein ACKUBY_03115 [Candidatus Moraniibacteriota bacterium]
MSKASRRKSNKNKKHKRKKQEREQSCLKHTKEMRQLRFVAYMWEDDACDFSGVLCNMKVDNIIKAKYQNFCFDDVMYTRISLHVYNDNVCKAYQLMESSALTAVGSEQFISPKCRGLFSHRITQENLCVVGQITHETVDQFNGDVKESQALYDSEILFYQLPHSVNIFVEIYTNDINRESAIAVLDDGWMSNKWGSQFQQVKRTGALQ